jgi:arabinofuranosyltransferase
VLQRTLSARPWVFVICFVAGAALVRRFFAHTVDDAFISFRYAEHWSEGIGLVFNRGERVEGYTDFLWVALMAGLHAAGADLESGAKVLGALSSTATLALVVLHSPRPEHSRWLVFVAPVLLATNPAFALWTVGGLETPLFTALITAAVTAAAAATRAPMSPYWIGVILALAALTRPEGVGVLGLVAIAWFAFADVDARVRRRELTRLLLAFASVFIPYFVWRTAYYGALLPNTFHAKVGADVAQLVRGARYVDDYLAAGGAGVLLLCAGLIKARERPESGVLGVVALGFTAYLVAIGGDGLMMYRFLVPILPLAFLLAAHGAAAWIEQRGGDRRVASAVAFVFALTAAFSSRDAFTGEAYEAVRQDLREVATWTAVGRFFRAHARPDASLAVIAAGAMPYYSRCTAIDMLGLNDAVIAHRRVAEMGRGQAGHEKHDVDYVLARKPSYIVVGVYALAAPATTTPYQLQPFYPAERELLADSRFRREYSTRQALTAGGRFAYAERITP